MAPTTETMKGLVYNGVGKIAIEERPVPTIKKPADAVVKMVYSTICGSDLHILKGDVPSVPPGRVLGHEGVGIVTATGSNVSRFAPGDAVLVGCITVCGSCAHCRRGMHSNCTADDNDGGWVLGNAIDGTQAQYVRIPHADNSLHRVPAASSSSSAAHLDDEDHLKALVMLSDTLPTGLECGALNSRVTPGSSVAIVGAGPVGLAALLTAQLYSPSFVVVVDLDAERLAVARSMGAQHTAKPDEAVALVQRLTEGRGCDAVMEVVGVPQTFALCQELVAAGGVIANVGVHGEKVDLHLEKLWSKNIAITTRLVDTVTTPMLLKLFAAGKLPAEKLITHTFPFSDIMTAYDTFRAASKTKALKVIIDFEQDVPGAAGVRGARL
ncbi:alcohol dehydrogenase [Phyllosticta citribraziliensis]|uniref:Alcohol dehydrogenase n=1 Tax=Phyllosticta citribraziliensis TaxID=989973 RepID=A0ABR1L511_9PEZI